MGKEIGTYFMYAYLGLVRELVQLESIRIYFLSCSSLPFKFYLFRNNYRSKTCQSRNTNMWSPSINDSHLFFVCFWLRIGKGKSEDGEGINLNDIGKVLPAWQVSFQVLFVYTDAQSNTELKFGMENSSVFWAKGLLCKILMLFRCPDSLPESSSVKSLGLQWNAWERHLHFCNGQNWRRIDSFSLTFKGKQAKWPQGGGDGGKWELLCWAPSGLATWGPDPNDLIADDTAG